MNTFEEARSIRDLCEYYCYRCSVGLNDCKIPATDCVKISSDRDFERVMRAKEFITDCQWMR